jgi:hypothetical protein
MILEKESIIIGRINAKSGKVFGGIFSMLFLNRFCRTKPFSAKNSPEKF